MMRIAIDATVVAARLKGAGRVVKNLLIALPKVDPGTEYVALAFPEGAQMLESFAADFAVAVAPPMSGLRWEVHGMASMAKSRGVDVVLTLREVVGFGGPPTLMHVAEPPSYRLALGWGKRSAKHVAKDWLLQVMLGGSIRRAARVTSASQTTADWLKQRYGIESSVIPPGVDPLFLEQIPFPERDRTHRYFLHPATGDQRDNTDLVLRAFALSGLSDVRLVLVGTATDTEGMVNQSARILGIDDRVEFAGWVTDERLRELYRAALALVHPSRYEGFAGLQPLEAMAQGTPVIALDSSGATEALTGAAELVRTEHAEELADAMARLARDEHARTELGAIGRERIRNLTWEAAAARFAEVLRWIAAP